MTYRPFLAGDELYAIEQHASGNDIVAVRGQQPIRREEFRADTAALAARLPSHRYVLNACTDRYRFMVGFAAALHRGQISLMPSSVAPGVLQNLADDYPDLYALTDTAPLPLPGLVYPDDLSDSHATPGMLAVPGEQPALILFTSGSTGRPKPVPKSWGALVRSAQAAGDRLGVSRLHGATLIGTVPHQHSYGLESMVMLGLQRGLTLNAISPLYPADIRAAIERAPRPRILVTTPVHIRALLAEPDGMPPVDLILSATAPLPAALAVQAETCFDAPLIEIYGCTEAGQIATRRTARETQWHCFNGVNLTQNGQNTWASGPAVEGKEQLQDTIEMTGPETFILGDRSADLVNIAGKRTSLAHLNHQLQSIQGVKDGVFLMEETDGPRVARLMALAVAPNLRAEAILQGLRERIDPAFLPRPLVIVTELPRNALGKLPREALLKLVGRPPGA
ncbi:MAG: AMP-binding protein [Acidocella sp.]|nr:AMP-binding protein [Acidocella sp.]